MTEALDQWGGYVLAAAATLPAAALLVAALAALRIRRGGATGPAWRDSAAEVGIVFGTAPWLAMGLTPVDGPSAVSLVPFVDLAELGEASLGTAYVQLVANLLVFAALGALLPVRFPVGLPTVAVVAALGSTTLEVAQYLLDAGRVSSVDDVLLNTVGAVLAATASRRWWRVPRRGNAAREPGGATVLRSGRRNWRGPSATGSRRRERRRRTAETPWHGPGSSLLNGVFDGRSTGGAPPGSGTAEPATAVERLGRSHSLDQEQCITSEQHFGHLCQRRRRRLR